MKEDKFCPAGKIPCEHFDIRESFNSKEILGFCRPTKGDAAATVLKISTQCHCPELQEKVESRYFRFKQSLLSDGFTVDKVAIAVGALIKAGYEDE